MNLANSLIEKVLTRRDVIEMADKFGLVISRSFEKDQTIRSLLEEYFDKETLSAIQETINANKELSSDQNQALKEVKSAMETLPNLRLTVAIKPPVHMVQSLSRFLRKEVNPLMTLEFDIDPKIIGGAVVVSNGKIFDHSVKKMVDDFFNKNQEKIITKIHHD